VNIYVVISFAAWSDSTSAVYSVWKAILKSFTRLSGVTGTPRNISMLSLQRSGVGGDVGSGLVSIENSSPEVIHVVNVSGTQQRANPVVAVNQALSNMQTITISTGFGVFHFLVIS
jgi:hypothetical protein